MRRAGEWEQAYLEFARARSRQLYRSACLLTGGDTHLAEDLVQETLGRMYLVWGRIARVGNPAGYAQTVLVRSYLAHARRRSSGERPAAELPDAPGRPEADAVLRLTLLDALRQLSAKDRAVVVLRYWEDRSIEDTADVMHVSSSAVRTRSVRALARLREVLGGGGIEEFGEYGRCGDRPQQGQQGQQGQRRPQEKQGQQARCGEFRGDADVVRG